LNITFLFLNEVDGETSRHNSPEHPKEGSGVKPRIVVVGSANTDMLVHVDHLPNRGETVMGGQFLIARGGKGANQAVAASRLGAEVTFLARLGRDQFGQDSFAAYQAEGILMDHIQWDDQAPSGVALIMVDRIGDNSIAVVPGANARLSPEDVYAAEKAIRSADCVLLQLEIPLQTVEAAVSLAHKHGVRVVLNPAPAMRLPASLTRKVNTLTPNETEIAVLAGVETPRNILDIAATIYTVSGVENLVVTMGDKGALIASMDNTMVPAFAIKAVDTVGAGDAFNGALAVALARGENLVDAVRYANAVGALSTTRPGAQSSLPLTWEVENFLRRNPVPGVRQMTA
jgi:ribokinase